jgi:hypothetical protein
VQETFSFPGFGCVPCVAGGEAVVTGRVVVVVVVSGVTVIVDVTDTEGETVRVTVFMMTGDSVPETVATAPAETVNFVV